MSSSTISNLLRNSRLAHIPKSDKPFFEAGRKLYPSHQVIETKPSTLHRQEWGLKASLPSKTRSRYVVVKELDTLERLTAFEPMGQYQWNRVRFQELGLAPTYSSKQTNPLFAGNSTRKNSGSLLPGCVGSSSGNVKTITRKDLKSIEALRPVFKNWLQGNHPEFATNWLTCDRKQLNKLAGDFLKTYFDQRGSAKGEWKTVGTGGLTYNLRGRLRQSPKGVKHGVVAEGRILHANSSDKAVALGGFVASASGLGRNIRKLDYEFGDFIRQERFPFVVKGAKVNEEGKILLDVSLIEKGADSMKRNGKYVAMPRNNQYIYQRGTGEGKTINPAQSAMQAEELLSIFVKGQIEI